MLRNYFKIAIRNIQQHTSYSLINVLGLSLGIACGLLIFSLVKYHLSFDNFHHHSDRVYRFVTDQHRDVISHDGSVPNPLGKAFREDYTFSEKVARIYTSYDELITIDKGTGIEKFKEEIAFAETEFFDIFYYPLVQGNINTALLQPNTALLTESFARKYFGDENPINKTFTLNSKIHFEVTGILKDLPENTDRKTEIYLSYSTLKQFNEWAASDDSWGGITSSMQCFTRLKPGVKPSEAEAVLPAYVKKYRPASKSIHHYKLQPLSEVHFDERYGGPMEKKNLWVLSFIGLFLIVTACVNFINLATAQAINRAKEVGVRKVLGSVRKQLFWQFILETGVITVVATFIAFAMSFTALPYVNEWFESQINIDIFNDWQLLVFVPVLVVLVTLFSGSYPGLILSGFQPVQALKGKLSQQRIGGFNVRRALIVTQFTISQVLIIGLIVIVYQMQYAKETDLGFKKDAIVMIPVGSNDEKMTTLKHQLLEIPGVEKVSACFVPPASTSSWRNSFSFDNRAEDEVFSISYKGADEDYLSTFDLELVAGRNLFPFDTVREFLVNETFLKKLNLKSPDDVLGKKLSANGGKWNGPIVGVLKDFHDKTFHEEINPVFIATNRDQYYSYAVRIKPTDIKATLAALDKQWNAMYPDKLYEYTFLDNDIAEFYKAEDTMMKLIQVFAVIAIFIGCMGLYGLVSFMAAQKTKEIGIRKVLGSNIHQILWIFGKEFLLLIIISFILAAPVGWWVMNGWLQDFEYKIEINVWVFVLAIGITSLVALMTVCYQSLRAALMNPVISLKAE